MDTEQQLRDARNKLSQAAYMLGFALGGIGGLHMMVKTGQNIDANQVRELRDILARGASEIFYEKTKDELC